MGTTREVFPISPIEALLSLQESGSITVMISMMRSGQDRVYIGSSVGEAIASVQDLAEREKPAPSVQQSGALALIVHGSFLLSLSLSPYSLAPARLASRPTHYALLAGAETHR